MVHPVEGQGASAPNAPAHGVLETPQIVQRLASLPGVGSTLSRITSIYDAYGRNSDISLVKKVCATAEETAAKLSSAALPIIDPYMDKIHAIDSFTCDKFDKLSSTVSSTTEFVRELPKKVNEKTAEVLTTLNERIAPQTVEDATIATLDSLYESKERTIERITTTAATTVHAIEARVAGVTSRVLDVADLIVDRVVPAPASDSSSDSAPAEHSSHPHEAVVNESASAVDGRSFAAVAAVGSDHEREYRPKVGTEAAKVLRKARAMTSKVQARLYARAINQIQFAKRRSQDVIDAFKPYTVNLLEYAEGLLDEAMEEDRDRAAEKQEQQEEKALSSARSQNTLISIPSSPAATQLANKLQAASRKILVKALHAAIRSRRWASEKVAVVRLRINLDTLKPANIASSASDLISSARMQVFSVADNATKLVHDRVLAIQPVIPELAAKAVKVLPAPIKSSIDHVYNLYEDHRLVEGLLEDIEGAKAALVEIISHLPLGSYLVLNKDAQQSEQVIAVHTGSGNIEVLAVHEVSELHMQSGTDSSSPSSSHNSSFSGAEVEEQIVVESTNVSVISEHPDNANFM